MRQVKVENRKPDVVLGVVLGIGAAGLTSIVAIAIYAMQGSRAFEEFDVTLGSLIAYYWAGGIIGGALFGLLLPLAKWRWGAIIVGIIAACPVYLGMSVLLGDRDLYSGLIAAIFVGGICGYGLWTPPGASTAKRME